MRPRLTTILTLLGLGAVVNVGVAWGVSAFPLFVKTDYYRPNQADWEWWGENAPSGYERAGGYRPVQRADVIFWSAQERA